MKFRNIRVKKAGGGHRTQRAMVLASGKLKFVKNKRSHSHAPARKKRKKHHAKGHHHVAKRRKKSHHKRRRSHRRHHSGGSFFGVLPKEDAMLAAGAAAFGWAEKSAKADANFILNKLPKFIDGLGWAGNTAVGLYVANKFLIRNPMLGKGAKVALIIAGYQLGRRGKMFDKADQFFEVSGADYLSGGERYLDEHSMGALEAEAQMSGGIPFDSEVHDAVAHT